MIIGIATRVVQGLLPLLILYLTKLVVDTVTTGVSSETHQIAFNRVIWLVVLSGIVIICQSIIRAIGDFTSEKQSQVLTDQVQQSIQAKSIELDLAHYENPEYYDTLHRAQREGSFRPQRIQRGIAGLIQNGISLIAVFGLLIAFQPLIAPVLIIAALPGIWLRLRFTDKYFDWQRRRTEDYRRTSYFHRLLTDLNYAKEIRLFNLGDLVSDWYVKLRCILRQEYLKLSVRRITGELVIQAGAAMAVFVCLIYIIRQTFDGAITLGDMVMYFMALQRGMGFLQQFLSTLANLYEDNLFLAHYQDLLAFKPTVHIPDKPVAVPHIFDKGLKIQNLTFSYPGTEKEVLHDVSMDIRPQETVAIVGKNGSGKTTLIKLICRFYQPDTGSIQIEGIDLMQIAPVDWRKKVRVIFQDFARYNLTARENIWFGDREIDPNDERVNSVAELAGISDSIESLPNGYDTILGKMFDSGAELSIGEWQKIALARAFLHDGELLILDEPTSGMDAQAEAELFNNFKKIAKDKTSIIISHRFSTIRLADKIYVLEKGSLVETGTHNELLDLDGKYAEMFNTQSGMYQ
ncbi:ABC transporter ATP-binding protein [Calditrichota bacterium]